MARAPFQILVFLYKKGENKDALYGIFLRADAHFWQGLSGGGEDNESPLVAAKREIFEESGISVSANFIQLDSIDSIPTIHFKESYLWGDNIYVIPEYAFGVCVQENDDIKLSHEHEAFRWVTLNDALALLKFDSNKTALRELDQKIHGKDP